MLLVLIAGLTVLCVLGLTFRFPRPACTVWILILETSPDSWLDNLIGGHEIIIGVMKALGLVLVISLAIANGIRSDRYNPGFAFLFMYLIGLMHGLYPGLSLLASTRSLLGSAGPFLFSFVRLPPILIRGIQRAVLWGPLCTVGFGGLLAATGLDHMYVFEQGALRLGASGEPPFLAGFALIGVYAALIACLDEARGLEAGFVLINLTIILLTGARAPFALGIGITIAALLSQRRLTLLAALGACAAAAIMFAPALTFLRPVQLAELGEAASLSNRNLVWPYFFNAAAASPVTGWGVGAGKIIIPVTSHLTSLIGTNAAHDEYLRIGAEGGTIGLALLISLIILWVWRGSAALHAPQRRLMRLIFIAFAIHSATDNTLIATTSSVFFIWVSAVFATAAERRTAPA